MKYTTISLLALATQVTAQAASHPFQPPGRDDVRSPCPGLNSLANHGFLPHDGKGMTLGKLSKGLKDGLNVGVDFTLAIGTLGLQSAPLPLSLSFDLDDLSEHNFPIEHDASLSRADFYPGRDDNSFNQSVFDQVLAFYEGMDTTTIPVASEARYARVKTSRANNPEMIYGARQLVLSYGETALYLSVMGDPITGKAPISYVKSFFEEERLPYELGWEKPKLEVNLVTLGAMVAELELANPEAVPEGLTLGTGTLKDVYSLKDPLTGKLINATCGLLGLC